MSKLGDVNKMYGQDFGVAVTNASADIVANSERLMSNMMIISSPMNSNNEDVEYPALFATDYNGKPIQLSYSVFIGNGLALNPNRILYLNIDSQTIKPQDNDGPLYVDTSYLQIASFNKPGVAMVANTVSRAGSNMPTNTFINIDNNGVLYLSNDFFTWFASQLNDAIYRNVAPLVNKNTRAWFTEMTSDTMQSNYYDTDAIMVSPIGQTRNYIEKTLRLSFTSPESKPLTISIDDGNQTNDYPFMDLEYNNQTIIDESKTQTIAGISIYEHHVDGIKLRFFPNYYLINNKNYGDTIHYYLRVDTNTEDNENQDIIFNFYQYQGSEILFNNLTPSLSLYELSTWINENNKKDQQIEIKLDFEYDNLVNTDDFSNRFEYSLSIQYLGSTPITLYDDNITDLINNSTNKKISIKLDNLDTLANIILNSSTLDQSTIQLSENSVSRYNSTLKINVGGRQFTYSQEFNLNYKQTGNFDSSFELYNPKLYSFYDDEENQEASSYKLLNIGESANIENISIKDDQSIKDIFQNDSIILLLNAEVGPQNVSSLSSDQKSVLELVGGPTDSSFPIVPSSIDANINVNISPDINNISKTLTLNITVLRKDFFNQNSQNGIYLLTMTMNSDHMGSKVITISIDIYQYIKNNILVYSNEDLSSEHKMDITDSENPVTLSIGTSIYIDFNPIINGLGVKLVGIAESGNWEYSAMENNTNVYKFTPQSVSEGNIISLSPIFGNGEGDNRYTITIGNIFTNNSIHGAHDNSGSGDSGNTPGGNTPGGGGDSGNTPGGNTPSGGDDSGNTPSGTDIDYWNSQPSDAGNYTLGVYATDSAISNNESVNVNQILGDTRLELGPDRAGQTSTFAFAPVSQNTYGLRSAVTRSNDDEIVYSAGNINYKAESAQFDTEHSLAYMPYKLVSNTENQDTNGLYLYKLNGTYKMTGSTDVYIVESTGKSHSDLDGIINITSELSAINYEESQGYIPLGQQLNTDLIKTTDYYVPYIAEVVGGTPDWMEQEMITSQYPNMVIQPNTGTERTWKVRYMAPGFSDGQANHMWEINMIQHGDQDPGISFSVDVSNASERLITGEAETVKGTYDNPSNQTFTFTGIHKGTLTLYTAYSSEYGGLFDNGGDSAVFNFQFSSEITSIKPYACEYLLGSTFDYIEPNGIQISGNSLTITIRSTRYFGDDGYPSVQTDGIRVLLNDKFVFYILINLRPKYSLYDRGFSFKDDLSLEFGATYGQNEADNSTFAVMISNNLYDLNSTLNIQSLSYTTDEYFGRTLDAYLVRRSESAKILARYRNTEFKYEVSYDDYYVRYSDGKGLVYCLSRKLVNWHTRSDDGKQSYWTYQSYSQVNEGYRIKINGQAGYLPWVSYRIQPGADDYIHVELYHQDNPNKILAYTYLRPNSWDSPISLSDTNTYLITSDVLTINDDGSGTITFKASKNGTNISDASGYYIKIESVATHYSLNVESYIDSNFILQFRNNEYAQGASHGNPYGIRVILYDTNNNELAYRTIFEAGVTGKIVDNGNR